MANPIGRWGWGAALMSCDAKAWPDQHGWHAIHDGPCDHPLSHDNSPWGLAETLISVELCMEGHLRWELFVFENGVGLRGYRA